MLKIIMFSSLLVFLAGCSTNSTTDQSLLELSSDQNIQHETSNGKDTQEEPWKQIFEENPLFHVQLIGGSNNNELLIKYGAKKEEFSAFYSPFTSDELTSNEVEKLTISVKDPEDKEYNFDIPYVEYNDKQYFFLEYFDRNGLYFQKMLRSPKNEEYALDKNK